VVANGLGASEFVPVEPDAGAAELLYVGELREAKGIDTLLEALPLVARARGVPPRAILVGSGPDQARLTERARRLGVASRVEFRGPMPAREAFKLGRILVVPSRAESMPYVVLEAGGARMPMVATDVGGIPEIFGPFADRLGPCDNPADLARRIAAMLETPADTLREEAADFALHIAGTFNIQAMVTSVISGYREALATRRARSPALASPAPSAT
jgi:glycosyltransferase involved in cell wall biosynthesis